MASAQFDPGWSIKVFRRDPTDPPWTLNPRPVVSPFFSKAGTIPRRYRGRLAAGRQGRYQFAPVTENFVDFDPRRADAKSPRELLPASQIKR
jgi:hypothetical protein